MADQKFYVEDTVALKSDPLCLGRVDRTYGDVTSHQPLLGDSYTSGINRSKHISQATFKGFIRSGAPPRGTLLVSWIYVPWQKAKRTTLLRESDITLRDRSLMAGDIVKRRAEDAMSGTVINTKTAVTLVQPKPWSEPTTQSPKEHLKKRRLGNYFLASSKLLHNVSSDDLILANRYNVDDFVIYNDWVGRITFKVEDFYVRLSNNSIVVPEIWDSVDDEDVTHSSIGDPIGYHPAVGDYFGAKKAKFRRGRWIYGAYNANVEADGYVADIRTTELSVDWLFSKRTAWTFETSTKPPEEIDHDTLESGQVTIYDRRQLSRSTFGVDQTADSAGLHDERRDLDLMTGDSVRFRDLAGAAVKYDGSALLSNGTTQVPLERIARTDSLGYDINVFKVAFTTTTATIVWQDLTTSVLSSNQLIPHLDIDGDDEVWPGELIATRQTSQTSDGEEKPDRVGIVQAVNAQDRIARVKWFPLASMTYHVVEDPTLVSGSITGPLSNDVQDVSLYDIWSLPGMSRRVGDFVAVRPCDSHKTKGILPYFYDFARSLVDAEETIDWFGEVIELGFDGLLTIRLGASSDVRDVRLPWECTSLVYSTDLEDETGHEDDYEEGSWSDDDTATTTETDSEMPDLVEVQDPDGQWRDITEQDDEDFEDWITDDDNEQSFMEEDDICSESEGDGRIDDNSDNEMTDAPEEAVQQLPQSSLPSKPTSRSDFSYSSMFNSLSSDIWPEQFTILDSPPASDHHYVNRTPSNNVSRLRRIQREYGILKTSLPAGVYVRTWESALDLIRVMILGPIDTPYEYAPFVIDLYLDSNYPDLPPQAFFHSWTNGSGPINPNLYEDGKICLSLLGTWPGDESNEKWSSSKSTILQLLVSLLGLVLVNEPFYNEAGYEARAGTAEARIPSAIYSERTYFNSRAFIVHALTQPVEGFELVLEALYRRSRLSSGDRGGPCLLYRAIKEAINVMIRSRGSSLGDGNRRTVSVGALMPLGRQVEALLNILKECDHDGATEVEALLSTTR